MTQACKKMAMRLATCVRGGGFVTHVLKQNSYLFNDESSLSEKY